MKPIKNVKYIKSPIGLIKLVGTDLGLELLSFVEEQENDESCSDFLNGVAVQLKDYFEEDRKMFEVPLNLTGSEFQKKVWDQLLTIPYGKTVSYSDIAYAIGDKNSVRAVGMANNKNPVAIIIPCHRVIGKDGALVGYAGGLNKKEWLLNHEKARYKKNDQYEIF